MGIHSRHHGYKVAIETSHTIYQSRKKDIYAALGTDHNQACYDVMGSDTQTSVAGQVVHEATVRVVQRSSI